MLSLSPSACKEGKALDDGKHAYDKTAGILVLLEVLKHLKSTAPELWREAWKKDPDQVTAQLEEVEDQQE